MRLSPAAWCHIHDVFEAEGALSTVTFAPIAADFLFNPKNSKSPDRWVTADVLSRVDAHSFLGIDLYQTSSNQGRSLLTKPTRCTLAADLSLGSSHPGAAPRSR